MTDDLHATGSRAAKPAVDRLYELIHAATHGIPGHPIPIHRNDRECPCCMDAAKAVLLHINEDVLRG